jgi:hypothetical protein
LSDPIGVVDRYFAAMRRGGAAEEEMMGLFADDAVYIEPFTNPALPAVGKEEIRNRLRAGWANPLPEMTLTVSGIEVTSAGAVSRWECRSPVLPEPVYGEDVYVIENGLISRLEVRILQDRDSG